ncbi:DNA-directed RNA polymerase sigma-70 factor [Actinoplanes lobatus]|uniref:DNA-directed RNA polymerase sigma-70 factor n=1 Tax=Actinoplanes lobatus TaxID=113568 RepID=A0A7W7HK90_9ACTN|nr:sigma-70 family RNA polymerase sigma factor [Actinoplanes lobatus]MBB4752034.1 RNA polymerase sigma-70 factor (ECF subfamily) [Actinoplanes lobatus]GGN85002.1 DNA-directed RNA polymerase sigma-70 factor [Actinoplanes lobatus]GIE45363.1 DNA-directed RNA polymerase sigma-70 factor [Actinoplanes lobatus]
MTAAGAQVPGPDGDAALVARARAGDSAAFATLAGACRTRVWAICLRLTGNHADAEDALQDALMAAWQHLGSFRQDARFSTWLYRIAANAALAVVRRRRDTPFAVDEHDYLIVVDDHADQHAERDRVQAALSQVPEPFRTALVLREYGELSYEEIAAHQNVGVQTVKSRLYRARASMVALLRAG